MRSYIISKALQYVLVLLATSVIIFTLVRLGPTDPVSVILGGKQSTPATIASVRHQFGLDKPVLVQYKNWMVGMLHGDFGMSFQFRQPVSTLIAQRLPVTAGIVLLSTIISVIISIPTGVIMAVKQHSWIDTLTSVVELILVACPPFLTGILMIWFLTVHAPGFSFTGGYSNWGEFFQRISLPSLALSFSMIALTARVMKSGMVEQLHTDYYTVASSKGLTKWEIVWKHCFRNAIIPVVTILGMQIGILLVGSALVETVFSLPGLGTLLVNAVQASDYGVVQAVTMLMVFIFMTISTILDLIYGVIDPRIRKKGGIA